MILNCSRKKKKRFDNLIGERKNKQQQTTNQPTLFSVRAKFTGAGKTLPKSGRKSLQPYLQHKVFADQVTAKMDSNTVCALKVSWKCPAMEFIQTENMFALSNSYKRKYRKYLLQTASRFLLTPHQSHLLCKSHHSLRHCLKQARGALSSVLSFVLNRFRL